jgi:hypothetical protein
MSVTLRYAQEIPPGADGKDGKDGAAAETPETISDDPRKARPVYRVAQAASTIVCNLKESRAFRISAEGDFELAFAGVANGDKVSVSITQDAIGGHAVTFLDTIRWANGGTPPTLTATADKRDTLGFEVFLEAGVFVYDGFVIGQDI